MLIKRLTLSVLAGAILLLPVLAVSQQQEPGLKGPGCKMLADLNLTDTQKASLKEYYQEIVAVRQKSHESTREVRQKIKDELLKSNPSKEILDQYAQQLADLHKQMAIAHNVHLLKIKGLLTPDQFSKMINFMGEQGERGFGMRKGSGRMCSESANGCPKAGKGCPNAGNGCPKAGRSFE